MDPRFEQYCRKWTSDVADMDDQPERLRYFQEQLPLLLMDRQTVTAVLTLMGRGRRWPDLRQTGLFKHEVLLYLDASLRFSVRIYFHPPNTHTPIHDHTSWGVSGSPFGNLSVVRYAHDGIEPYGFVRLRKTDAKILPAGQVELTPSWDQGIHKTGSAENSMNVMISVYGRPGRRLYVNTFDEITGQVTRIYPPRFFRRHLAEEALRIYHSIKQ